MIPTAKEFLSEHTNRVAFPCIDKLIEDNDPQAETILKSMIEFAKLHVEKALESAYKDSNIRITENALIEEGYLYGTYDDGVFTYSIDKDSILNAYPLTNIK